MAEINIRIYRDGDQTCAIIGHMPTELAVGFGEGVKEALIELERNTNNILGICPACWNESDRFDDGEHINCTCPNCGYEWVEVP